MANNINLSSARYATSYMMPDGDEEVNALWGRKIAWNTARGVGAWGTAIIEGLVFTTMGTLRVDLSSLGFKTLPSVDLYQYRGGSQPAMCFPVSDNSIQNLGVYPVINGGTEFKIFMWGDGFEGTLIDFSNYATWQKDFGTFIYRFRGW